MSLTNLTRLLARATLLRCAAAVSEAGQIHAEYRAERCDPLARRTLADACGETVTVQYQVVEG